MRATLLSLLAAVLALLFLFPFLWTISLSLRPGTMLYAVPGWGIPFLDFTPTLDAWRGELASLHLGRALRHSTAIGAGATALALLLALPAAWALARPGAVPRADLLLVGFLSLRLLPPVGLVVPFYVLAQRLGLLDTALVLVLINATLVFPFAVLILRQGFADIPAEVEEAAALDGAGPIRAFVRIVLPLCAPSIAATALILLAFAWNDVMFATTLLVMDMVTLPILISGYGSVSAGGAVTMLVTTAVPLVAALLAQRWLVGAMTLGAVRG